MWSRLAFCLLVSVVYASYGSHSPAWDHNSKYLYSVRTRSLVSLDQVASDYSGFLIKAVIEISPRSDGNLDGRILNPKSAPIHGALREGWNQYIPDSDVSYQQLQVSPEPFQIELSKTVVRNIIVSKNINNWEANIIKSFVSQFQLDVEAQNLIPSPINAPPENEYDSSIFKTMEETVTGVSETLYEIHELPRLLVEAQPWLVNDKYVEEDDKYLEVIKTKNFTHSKVAPSYHFGLDGLRHYEPSNKVGNFLSRSSVSTAVLTGSLQNYTIQNSVTIEEIFVTPTLSGKQKGSLHTIVNVTLQEIIQESQNDNNVVNPVEVGVVYGYDSPFADINEPRPHKPFSHSGRSSENSASQESISERKIKIKRSILGSASDNAVADSSSLEASSKSSEQSSDDVDWLQSKPSLQKAPETALLPLFVGYNGQSIKKQQNVVDTARKLAQKIAQEYETPKKILEENTVGAFVLLSSLIRVMDLEEIQQVAEQLYTKQTRGVEAAAWFAFYSAVAQAGTGPALSALIEFLQTDKIVELEAAEAIATAADSAREPTLEYMQAFFQLLQNDKFMSQRSLNESLVLSFSVLAHEVYINREVSHNKYPGHIFGSFRNEQGQEFVQKQVVPFLNKKLSNAYNQRDTQQLHVYIRALGNIGDYSILPAFEPYLENEMPASSVQRVHMILALDYLTRTHPAEVRSIAYKIAENPAEEEEVRVAAVYQLMRTNPSAVMLQRIALYTQVDNAHYVNSAVKSAIIGASELEGPEHAELRVAAQSARPLLTSREYGLQYSQLFLRSFVSRMYEQESYKQTMLLFGGQDNAISRGLLYSLRANYGGVQQRFVTVQLLASSIDDLFVAFKQQTKKHQEQVEEKEQGNPEQKPWSSEYVAKLLQMKNQQREQMESFLFFKVSAMQKLFSINNQTISELVQLAQRFEEDLKEGQFYQYNSMKTIKEVAFAVPTALGLPFVYTLNVPVFVKAQAKVQASAHPQVVQDGLVQKPDTLNADFTVKALVSARLQSRLTIFTPFDAQRYSAGYDKNLQFEIPLSGQVEINFNVKQVKATILNPGHPQSTQLAHYSNVPFTAKNPIYTPKPNVKLIQSDQMNRIFYNFGRESTGVAFNVEVNAEQIINLPYIWDKLSKYDLITDMVGSWIDENIRYTSINFGISGSKSFTEKVVLEMGYDTEYTSQDSPSEQQISIKNIRSEIPEVDQDSLKRQQQFIEKASQGINNVRVVVADAVVQFLGQRRIQYQATAALAKSNVDPKGRFIALIKKNDQQQPPLRAYLDATARFPNTDALDLEYAMKMNSESTIDILALVERNQQVSRIETQVQLRKNQQRVQYLENQPNYKKYLQHRQLSLPVIAAMIAQANVLNEFDVSVQYKNLDPEIMQASYKVYSFARYFMFTRILEKLFTGRHEQNVKIQGQFSPDLSSLNATINSDYAEIQLNNLPVRRWAQVFLVPHPVFHLKSRVIGRALQLDTYRPICALNSKIVSTLDNNTYAPLLDSNAWSVLLQYVPRIPSDVNIEPKKPFLQSPQLALEQLRQLSESYIVLVRPQNSNQREVRLLFVSEQTESKLAEIRIQPVSNNRPTVEVNSKDVQFSEQQAANLYNGFVEVYALPNMEVKIELEGVLSVISNGETVRITTFNSKFRDAARGLCGTFTGEPHTDFLTPSNNIVEDVDDFVSSYSISAQNMTQRQSVSYQQRVSSSEEQEQDSQYGQKQSHRPRYISKIGHLANKHSNRANSCVRTQTRYVEEDNEICFTIKPLPVCKSRCRVDGHISKQVPVRCVPRNQSALLWKNQILQGDSPNFTEQEATKYVTMNTPRRCRS